MRNYFKNLSGLKIAVYFIALLAFIIAIQFIPVQPEAGVDGGINIEIGPIDIDLANPLANAPIIGTMVLAKVVYKLF